MPVRGGEFRQLAQFQRRSTIQGSMGGQAESWSTYATAYVAIQPLAGTERLAAQAANSAITHQITAYWTPGYTPTAADRLVIGSRVFDIRAIWNDDEANRVWIMQAQEGMTQG